MTFILSCLLPGFVSFPPRVSLHWSEGLRYLSTVVPTNILGRKIVNTLGIGGSQWMTMVSCGICYQLLDDVQVVLTRHSEEADEVDQNWISKWRNLEIMLDNNMHKKFRKVDWHQSRQNYANTLSFHIMQ